MHPFEEISELDEFVDWLKRHEPQLGEAIARRMGDVEDFLRVQDFAYSVERVYSPDRWSLVGEAGAFADPFYSPGSDFIGYGNVFTSGPGHPRPRRRGHLGAARVLQRLLLPHLRLRPRRSTRTSTSLFGNVWVAAHKLFWDAFFNHAGQVPMMVKDKIGDYEFMKSVDEDVDRLYRLSTNMQELFQDWHELEQRDEENPIIREAEMTLVRGFLGLVRPMDDDVLREELREEVKIAEDWAVTLFAIPRRRSTRSPTSTARSTRTRSASARTGGSRTGSTTSPGSRPTRRARPPWRPRSPRAWARLRALPRDRPPASPARPRT